MALFIFLHAPSFCQDSSVRDTLALQDALPGICKLEQVVVTGQFQPKPADQSVYSIRIIDSRQINQMAATSLGDVLRSDPKFQYQYAGTLGEFIRIRGLSGEYIKILIDGMPVTGRIDGKIDLSQLAMLEVDHIEIIEGPMAIVYGSNAMACVINIITVGGTKTNTEASVHAQYESAGIYNADLTLNTGRGHRSFNGYAGRYFFDGWSSDVTSRFKEWKPKRQYLGGLGYQYKNERLCLHLKNDFLQEELRDEDSLSLVRRYESALDAYHYTLRLNSRAGLTWSLPGKGSLNLQAGYSFYRKRRITYWNDLVNLQKTVTGGQGNSDTTAFHMVAARGFFSGSILRKVEYQTGLDMNHETAQGRRTGGFRAITEAGLFLNMIYQPHPKFSLQPGMRIIYNTEYAAPVVYGLSIRYNPSYFTFRATYANSFRAPSLKQLYLQFVDSNHEIYGNPELKAETARSLNISISADRQINRMAIYAEVAAFYNHIDNAIQLALSTQRPGWGKYFNLSERPFKTMGAECQLTGRFSPGLSVSLGMVLTGRMRLDSPESYVWTTDASVQTDYSMPKLKSRLSLQYKYNDTYLDFAGLYDAAENLIDLEQQVISSYHILDLAASQQFAKDRITISAGVKNLLDVALVKSAGNLSFHGSDQGNTAIGYGRSFFVKFTLTFKKK
jgi:outer membrane receptor for ferrienterochelin and colicins